MELDPIFQRALQLLVSRKPDSGEKLKEMLFESLGREYVPPPTPKLEPRVSHSHDSIESLDDDDEVMEAETDCSTDVGGAKNDDTMDADDFAFDMGISCVICRQFDVSSNNQLLECQECHSLYHQLCHKPPMNENQDVNDPRFIWYCHKCTPASKSSPEKIKVIDLADDEPIKKEKSTTSEAFKKPDKKSSTESKKSSEPSSSKEKKLKNDKRVREKLAEKIRGSESEKEKVKKHKTSDKDVKSESSRKDKEKTSSKSSDSTRSSNSTTKGSSKDKGLDNHSAKRKQSSSADLKHKKSDSLSDKEKKAKKVKREKPE